MDPWIRLIEANVVSVKQENVSKVTRGWHTKPSVVFGDGPVLRTVCGMVCVSSSRMRVRCVIYCRCYIILTASRMTTPAHFRHAPNNTWTEYYYCSLVPATSMKHLTLLVSNVDPLTRPA